MKFNRTPTTLEVEMVGPIGETTPMFNLPLAGLKEITLNMSGVTMINSIGIRQWIIWTNKIPADCIVKMVNCPYVIASQASMVVGFQKSNMKIESLRLPYMCEECGAEQFVAANRGTDYEYQNGETPMRLNLPEKLACPKCGKETSEPDFLAEKTFKFLESN